MMDVNSGYIGHSMSRRAAEAYEDGEMPKSKWTKKAMVAAIQSYCDEFDMFFDPDVLKGMRKDEVFERFFHESSWHHTSKFFNETDFYKLDEDAVCGSFRPMTDTEVAERDAVRIQDIEKEWAEREAMRVARIEQLDRHRAYREEHGFAPDTVAAFAHEHPECCEERISRKGNRVLSYIDFLAQEQVCPIDRIGETHLFGFDATEPGSFDEVIECRQLLDICEMLGNDHITLGGMRETSGIDLKGCGTVVTVDGHDYEIMKGATYEDSRKVDDLLDSHGDKPISDYRKRPQGMSLKQAVREAREASAKLAVENGDTDDPGGKDER